MGDISVKGKQVEVWGGLECTVNRVQNCYCDQITRSGHDKRIEDLEMFAALGLKRMRYPVLWERIAPESLDAPDWSWTDERLSCLRELGVEPIAGLLHHGSGPRYTSLLDPEFPEKFAEYCGIVAARYPWLRYYTPINEILTTARFSGLYGVWYPHGKDDSTFARCLLNECRATVLGMREIRKVQPAAELIQTDDLGKIHSTRLLSYQADFENERRWLGFDLLCGKLDEDHLMWHFLTKNAGVTTEELEWFRENRCPPDVLGLNYYLTSERFLDHRTRTYPTHTIGSNGRHRYADVEAVRVLADGVDGPEALLRECWNRFGLPMAVTEVHLGCTRGEQMRWVQEAWCAAQNLQADGVDIRAITPWALLGSYDWDCLLTRQSGHYEPGVFDLRSGKPRPTALAEMVRALATDGEYDHPVLANPGWWRRKHRLIYPAFPKKRIAGVCGFPRKKQPLLITGATGTLGRAFARICETRGLEYRLMSRSQFNITDARQVAETIEQLEPWAVINTAGYVRVDDAEKDVAACMRDNALGPAVLAEACEEARIGLVTFSSDLVFDGKALEPYTEDSQPAPLNVYGRSKAEAERRVLELMPNALIVRTSAFFGPWDEYNFLAKMEESALRGEEFTAPSDLTISPTYVPDLVHATLDLLIDKESGIWHLANDGETTWLAFALAAAAAMGLDATVKECRAQDCNFIAPRPEYTALTSARGRLMPTLQNAIERFASERERVAAPAELLANA